jgi:hypothetical protein
MLRGRTYVFSQDTDEWSTAHEDADGVKTRAAVVVLALALSVLMTPHARAAGLLAVGMEIVIGGHSCSLGFFAFNQQHDRLAVTSGHCADDINQAVYSNNRVEIGTVVSHMPESDSLEPVRVRGYTLIRLYDNFDLEVFFAGVADAKNDDLITKFGARTAETTGRVTDVESNGSLPEHTIIGSIVAIPGDSGSPWYTAGPTLVGITASVRNSIGGGDDSVSEAQPVGALVDLIRQNARPWGSGFTVWVK